MADKHQEKIELRGGDQNIGNDFHEIGRVVARHYSRSNKILKLSTGESLHCHRFALVAPGDALFKKKDCWYVQPKNAHETFEVFPAWSYTTYIHVGGERYELTVKEIETDEELDAFERLSSYHYRAQGSGGRRAVLVATLAVRSLPSVVGFVEVASALLATTARSTFFNRPFSEPDRRVAWTRWDNSISKKANAYFARISRCVIYPELRGLGVAVELLEAAKAFCRDRWHFGGVSPLFLEITADMLRFWPFVRRAGFAYIGDTEGNDSRLHKDMKYLLQKKQRESGIKFRTRGGGIMSMQKGYADVLTQVMERRGLSLNGVLEYVKRKPEKLSDEEWVELHKIYRRPKPTYLVGLTKASDSFVQQNAKHVGAMATGYSDKKRGWGGSGLRDTEARDNDLLAEIDIAELRIRHKPVVSSRARRVQEAFGITALEIERTLVEGVKLRICRGSVALISGPSGSGKSLLLDILSRELLKQGVNNDSPNRAVEYKGGITGFAHVAKVDPLAIRRFSSPLDALESCTLERSLELLAASGLAEPQVYLRPVEALSEGQQWRLATAVALAECPEILVVDSICESLDRFSAEAVCRGLRREAERRNTAVVAATSSPERIEDLLLPGKHLRIGLDGKCELSGT